MVSFTLGSDTRWPISSHFPEGCSRSDKTGGRTDGMAFSLRSSLCFISSARTSGRPDDRSFDCSDGRSVGPSVPFITPIISIAIFCCRFFSLASASGRRGKCSSLSRSLEKTMDIRCLVSYATTCTHTHTHTHTHIDLPCYVH